MRTNHILAGALCAVSVVALAAGAYGIRTRNIAINGWQAWASAEAERERLVAQLTGIDEIKSRMSPQLDAASAERQRLVGELNATSSNYRALWETVLGNVPTDDLAYALALNEHIHRNVRLGASDAKGDVARRLTTALLSRDEEALCGDYSVFLQMALQASGVPSRTVQLAAQDYVDGNVLGATHVTVEVLVGGRWIIVDPTFNATFSCGTSTDLVGVEDARRCPNLIAHQLPGTLPGRSVAEHNARYSDLLAYWMANSTRIGDKYIDWQAYPTRDWLVHAIQGQKRGDSPALRPTVDTQVE